MKKYLLLFLMLGMFTKANAFIAEVPTLEGIVKTMDTRIENNMYQQYIKMTESLTSMADQLYEARRMAQSLADGKITQEMIDFAFKTAKQCGIKTPAIILKDFPDLKFNICKDPLPFEKITAIFSFKDGFSIQKRNEIQVNVDKLREDNYVTALTTALTTRSLDRTKTIEDFTKQMSNQSISNLAYVGNEIELSQLTELVEIRKLLGLILEGQTLDRASSFNTQKQ